MSDLNDAQVAAMLELYTSMTNAAQDGVPVSEALSLWASWCVLCEHVGVNPGLMWWMLTAHDDSPVRNPAGV